MPVFVAASSGQSGSNNGVFLLLGVVVLLGVLMYVSNRRRRRQATEQQESLEVGSEVSTTSGMLGVLSALDADTATVEFAEGVHITFVRRAVVPRATLLPKSATASASDTSDSADASGAEGASELSQAPRTGLGAAQDAEPSTDVDEMNGVGSREQVDALGDPVHESGSDTGRRGAGA